MKLAYIYQCNLAINEANNYQSAVMAHELSHFYQVDWFRGFRQLYLRKNKKSTPDNLHHVPISNLKIKPNSSFIFEKFSRLLFCIHTLLILQFRQPDIIFTRDFGFLYFLSFVPGFMRLRIPIVFESHKIFYNVSNKVDKTREVQAYRLVDLFVSVSEGIKEDLIDSFGIPSNKIIVEPNCFDPSIFEKKRKRTELGDKMNIVYSGTFTADKGVDIIFEIADQLDPAKFHFHLMGGRKTMMQKYSKMVREQDLGKIITLYPIKKRRELFEFYDEMDIGLLPNASIGVSAKYTSPLKLFEYAGSGLTIVAAAVSPILELKNRGLKMKTFVPGNVVELKNTLQEISANGISEKLIKENLEFIENYTWDKRAYRISEAINDMFFSV